MKKEQSQKGLYRDGVNVVTGEVKEGLTVKSEPKRVNAEYKVDMSQLHAGKEFKNYKALCEAMGWKVFKSSNPRKAQFKALSSVCSWENEIDSDGKKKHKIIINDIYIKQKTVLDNRKVNKTTLVTRLVSRSLLELIKQYGSNETNASGIGNSIGFAFNDLHRTLGLTNGCYSLGSQKRFEIAESLGIPIEHFHDFYSRTYQSIEEIIQTSLKNLNKQCYLSYTYTKKAFYLPEITEDGVELPRSPEFLDPEQLNFVLRAKREVLNKYGMSTINSIHYKDSKFKERFYNDVYATIRQRAKQASAYNLRRLENIQFYCKGVVIHYYADTLNDAINKNGLLSYDEHLFVKEHLEQELLLNSPSCSFTGLIANKTNKEMMIKTETNASNRHAKAVKKPSPTDEKYKREDETYVDNTSTLAKIVIDKIEPISIDKIMLKKPAPRCLS